MNKPIIGLLCILTIGLASTPATAREGTAHATKSHEHEIGVGAGYTASQEILPIFDYRYRRGIAKNLDLSVSLGSDGYDGCAGFSCVGLAFGYQVLGPADGKGLSAKISLGAGYDIAGGLDLPLRLFLSLPIGNKQLSLGLGTTVIDTLGAVQPTQKHTAGPYTGDWIVDLEIYDAVISLRMPLKKITLRPALRVVYVPEHQTVDWEPIILPIASLGVIF